MGGSLTAFLSRLGRSASDAMSYLVVEQTHVSSTSADLDPSADLDQMFVADEHYFVIRLKSLHLQSGHKSLAKYVPVLTTACEFGYGGSRTVAPCVLGPGLIRTSDGRLPARVDFDDVRLCGLHPYRGGEIGVSVLLSMVAADPRLTRLMEFLEKASSALKLTAGVAPYAAVASLVAGALDDVANSADSVPVFGAGFSLSQDNGSLRSGYVVIATVSLRPEAVWIKGSEVRIGITAGDSVPLESDYVLLAIERSTTRSDAKCCGRTSRNLPGSPTNYRGSRSDAPAGGEPVPRLRRRSSSAPRRRVGPRSSWPGRERFSGCRRVIRGGTHRG